MGHPLDIFEQALALLLFTSIFIRALQPAPEPCRADTSTATRRKGVQQ